MSVESIAKVLPRQDVAGATKLVLLGIANHDGDGGAWPSVETLSKYAVVSVRRVQQILEDLKARGLVGVEYNAGGLSDSRHDRRPNRYTLHLDGVKPTAPRGPDGVKSETPRGETQGHHGVKPTSPEPSYEPSVRTEDPPTPHGGVACLDPDGFDDFWERYPRKTGKPDARKKLIFALKSTERAAVMHGLARWSAHWQEAQTDMKFIPHPATWLNQRRWEDDPPPLPAKQAKRQAFIKGIADLANGEPVDIWGYAMAKVRGELEAGS